MTNTSSSLLHFAQCNRRKRELDEETQKRQDAGEVVDTERLLGLDVLREQMLTETYVFGSWANENPRHIGGRDLATSERREAGKSP